MDNTSENYTTSKVARAYFNVSEMTFRRWIRQGAPHLKISKHVRVKLSEVEEWLKGKHETIQQSDPD